MPSLHTAIYVGPGPVPILWHCISPVPVPVPFPHKFCLNKPSVIYNWFDRNLLSRQCKSTIKFYFKHGYEGFHDAGPGGGSSL